MSETQELKQKIEYLSQHYDDLAIQHGYSHHAVQQSSLETQHKRFEILLEIMESNKTAKILDFGCGTAELFRLLTKHGFEGEYVGYDVSNKLIELAKKNNPNGRFELRDIFENPPSERFDYIFISGVFNNDIGINERFLKRTLKVLFPLVKKGLAFNSLSTYVDYKSEGLYYFDPCEVFKYCKEMISTNVTLRHDYEIKPGVIPFEFSIYLYAAEHKIVDLK